jgi:hypothetical protein
MDKGAALHMDKREAAGMDGRGMGELELVGRNPQTATDQGSTIAKAKKRPRRTSMQNKGTASLLEGSACLNKQLHAILEQEAATTATIDALHTALTKIMSNKNKRKASQNMSNMLSDAIPRCSKALRADAVVILLYNEHREVLWSKFASFSGFTARIATSVPNAEQRPEQLLKRRGASAATVCFSTGKSVNIPDRKEWITANNGNDPNFRSKVGYLSKYEVQSLLCSPLIGPQGQHLGVVQVMNKRPHLSDTTGMTNEQNNSSYELNQVSLGKRSFVPFVQHDASILECLCGLAAQRVSLALSLSLSLSLSRAHSVS